jgi:hypothetical protein
MGLSDFLELKTKDSILLLARNLKMDKEKKLELSFEILMSNIDLDKSNGVIHVSHTSTIRESELNFNLWDTHKIVRLNNSVVSKTKHEFESKLVELSTYNFLRDIIKDFVHSDEKTSKIKFRMIEKYIDNNINLKV